MNNKEIKALIALLDDDDLEVVGHVEEKIRNLGTGIIPILEDEWEGTFNPTMQGRIEDLVHDLQFELVKERLADWKENHQEDLLRGIWIVATYQYPDLELEDLKQQIEQLYHNIWSQLGDDMRPYDQIRAINGILFDKMKFRSNTKNFHSPGNSMINLVLESHKGNPISLSSIYLLIAQRLELPVYGVNLPNLFILTYKTDETQFYINVFNKGLIFTRDDIDNYIEHLQLSKEEMYYEPCDHLAMLVRYMRNLIVAFDKVGDYHKSDEVKMMLAVIEGAASL